MRLTRFPNEASVLTVIARCSAAEPDRTAAQQSGGRDGAVSDIYLIHSRLSRSDVGGIHFCCYCHSRTSDLIADTDCGSCLLFGASVVQLATFWLVVNSTGRYGTPVIRHLRCAMRLTVAPPVHHTGCKRLAFYASDAPQSKKIYATATVVQCSSLPRPSAPMSATGVVHWRGKTVSLTSRLGRPQMTYDRGS